MLISELSCSGRGSFITVTVWFITNRPRLATFWRTCFGIGLLLSVTSLRKIDQSLRL